MKPKPAVAVTVDELLDTLRGLIEPEVYFEAVALPTPSIVGQTDVGRWLSAESAEAYFECQSCERPTVDLAYLQRGRVFEDVLRDFVHIERHSRASTVVVIDGVLPTTQNMAWRVAPPSFERPEPWVADVFKLTALLGAERPDLTLRLVDAAPYGALIVSGLDSRNVVLDRRFERLVADWASWHIVPDDVFARTGSILVEDAIEELTAEIKKR